MAVITTYADLKSNLISFLYNRTELSEFLPTFIDLCESELNRILHVREQLQTVQLTPDVNGNITLPADYQMFRSATALTNPRIRLDHVVSGTLNEEYPSRQAGLPKVFAINDDSTATVLPLNQAPVELEYYSAIPSLSESNQTNWLLAKAPNVYLYGSLRHAAIFIGDEERLPLFNSVFSDSVTALKREDRSGTYGARTIARLSMVTP